MSDAKKLTSMDASFLYLETPEMPMHVGSMAIFRLPEDYKGNFFEEFKAMIASRLHVAPILKARLEKAPLDIDHPSWVEDDQFDIDRHIFRGSLPAPYDRATLERIVGWMHAKLLNRARPLWEFYVFEGMKDNEIGLYSKIHHACIDGGAGQLSNTILNSTFVKNLAQGGSGTAFNGFSARGGHGAGGGIFAAAGNYDLNIINDTFAANVAQGGQGALADGGNAAGGGTEAVGGDTVTSTTSPRNSSDSGSCSCRVVGKNDSTSSLWSVGLLGIAFAVWRRRERKQR